MGELKPCSLPDSPAPSEMMLEMEEDLDRCVILCVLYWKSPLVDYGFVVVSLKDKLIYENNGGCKVRNFLNRRGQKSERANRQKFCQSERIKPGDEEVLTNENKLKIRCGLSSSQFRRSMNSLASDFQIFGRKSDNNLVVSIQQ